MPDNKPNNPNKPPEENWLVSFGRSLGDATGLNDLFAKDPNLEKKLTHEQIHRDRFAYEEFKVNQNIKEVQDANKEEIQKQSEASAKRAEQADISSGYDKLSGLNVQPTDKRSVANQELRDIFDPGVVSLVNTEMDIGPVIPVSDISVPEAGDGTVQNNFNIHVTAPEKIQTKILQSNVNSIIKNALPTLTGSPEIIKKNLYQSYQNTFAPITNQYTEITKNEFFNTTQNNPTLQNVTFESAMGQYQNGQSIPGLILSDMKSDDVGFSMTTGDNNFTNVEKTKYMETNKTIQSTPNYNINNSSTILNNEYYNNITNQSNSFVGGDNSIQNIMSNTENNIDYVSHASKHMALEQKMLEFDQSIATAERRKNTNLQMRIDDTIEASTEKSFNDINAGLQSPSSGRGLPLSNITETTDQIYFLSNANNPPIWRVVAG